MADPGNTTVSSISSTAKSHKSQELATWTVKAPRFSYAHLRVLRNPTEPEELDAIQVRTYCTAALKQFLGVSGQAISIDILKVEGSDCWLRIPRDDLGAFAAALTAWQGIYENGTHSAIQIRGCSDWLGSLVGRDGEQRLWKR
jgi:ribonuclease P/MRP protein subunit POP8